MKRFMQWWQRPLAGKDRMIAVVVGAIGGFWAGVLGRMLSGPVPVSLEVLGYWAIASFLAGLVLGALFPKTVSVVLFPLSMIGIGSG